jgi:hypothetical protein
MSANSTGASAAQAPGDQEREHEQDGRVGQLVAGPLDDVEQTVGQAARVGVGSDMGFRHRVRSLKLAESLSQTDVSVGPRPAQQNRVTLGWHGQVYAHP